MAGAYVWWELTTNQGWAFFPGLIAGVAFSAILGALIHLLIMRPLRNGAPLVRVIATLGVLITLQAIAVLRYTATSKFVPSDLPTDIVHVHNTIVISADRLILLGIAAGLTLDALGLLPLLALRPRHLGRRRERALGLGPRPLTRHDRRPQLGARLRPRRPRRDPDRPDRHPAAGGADEPRARRHRGGAGRRLPLLPDRLDRRPGDRDRPDRGDALRRTARRRHRRALHPDRRLARDPRPGAAVARLPAAAPADDRHRPDQQDRPRDRSGGRRSSCWRRRRRSGSTPSR